MKKIELLAPAGNMEKLKTAVYFGCDAVYLAYKQFGLRAYADNFDAEQLQKAVEYCHANGKKVNRKVPVLARFPISFSAGNFRGCAVACAAPPLPKHVSCARTLSRYGAAP